MHPEYARRLVAEELQQALKSGGLFDDRMVLEEVIYPNIYIRVTNQKGQIRLLHFECDNYNFQPVAINPVDPQSRQPLLSEAWPRRGGGAFPGHQMRNGGPFLCLEGTRDFYTHESHRPSVTGDRWEVWRNELNLTTLLRTVKSKFVTGEWE